MPESSALRAKYNILYVVPGILPRVVRHASLQVSPLIIIVPYIGVHVRLAVLYVH